MQMNIVPLETGNGVICIIPNVVVIHGRGRLLCAQSTNSFDFTGTCFLQPPEHSCILYYPSVLKKYLEMGQTKRKRPKGNVSLK